jgi:hypothetical protein
MWGFCVTHFDALMMSPLLLIGLHPLGVQLSFRAAVPGTHSQQSPARQCGWVITKFGTQVQCRTDGFVPNKAI